MEAITVRLEAIATSNKKQLVVFSFASSGAKQGILLGRSGSRRPETVLDSRKKKTGVLVSSSDARSP